MFFYCTQKVDNHYKVGISSSYDGIKKRLSDYRQIQPGINIKFFTEIPSSSIENTFKNSGSFDESSAEEIKEEFLIDEINECDVNEDDHLKNFFEICKNVNNSK